VRYLNRATVGIVDCSGTAIHSSANQPEAVMVVAASERLTHDLLWAKLIIEEALKKGGKGKSRAVRALQCIEELHTISIAAHHARHPARGETKEVER
jgi:hypothetical protein